MSIEEVFALTNIPIFVCIILWVYIIYKFRVNILIQLNLNERYDKITFFAIAFSVSIWSLIMWGIVQLFYLATKKYIILGSPTSLNNIIFILSSFSLFFNYILATTSKKYFNIIDNKLSIIYDRINFARLYNSIKEEEIAFGKDLIIFVPYTKFLNNLDSNFSFEKSRNHNYYFMSFKILTKIHDIISIPFFLVCFGISKILPFLTLPFVFVYLLIDLFFRAILALPIVLKSLLIKYIFIFLIVLPINMMIILIVNNQSYKLFMRIIHFLAFITLVIAWYKN